MRREVGILGSSEVSARHSPIDKSKKRSYTPCERLSYSIIQIQSASFPKRSKSSHSGIPKRELERPHGEITPSHKAFWKVTKALKTEGYIPIPPLKRPDNLVAQTTGDSEMPCRLCRDSMLSSRLCDITLILIVLKKRFFINLPRTKRRFDSRLTQQKPNASEIIQNHKGNGPRWY
ncbi:hypothetical protein EVAR_70560_1 [Eumeta japonica]|uniref:Uncharacterized protein n=1 Tax=Eumeta variegata TaxID=151549 RepID=A0A4C2AHJ3_EUMVA|nr:hypothetical protein EVAR_70560_1 [Eumeta japonica]